MRKILKATREKTNAHRGKQIDRYTDNRYRYTHTPCKPLSNHNKKVSTNKPIVVIKGNTKKIQSRRNIIYQKQSKIENKEKIGDLKPDILIILLNINGLN